LRALLRKHGYTCNSKTLIRKIWNFSSNHEVPHFNYPEQLEIYLADTIFNNCSTVEFGSSNSTNSLAYQFYDAERVVLGKPLREHLRFSVAYWHSFAMTGSDPFGSSTIHRPWMAVGDAIAQAKAKADAAFEFCRVLDLPFFSFHDADIASEDEDLNGTLRNSHTIVDYIAEETSRSKTKLLWGTANLFSHPRFMAGASTNPDPELFAWCDTVVKHCMDATMLLGLTKGRLARCWNWNAQDQSQWMGRCSAVTFGQRLGYAAAP
jgi:xylose isomerase